MSSETQTQQEVPSVTLRGRQINAVNTLIQGIEVAQKKGAYTTGDASILYQAIRLLVDEHPAAPASSQMHVAGSLPPQPLKEDLQDLAFVPGGDE